MVPPSDLRPGVPHDVEGVVLRCLAKQPGARYQSVNALADALAACGSASEWDPGRSAAWWASRGCPGRGAGGGRSGMTDAWRATEKRRHPGPTTSSDSFEHPPGGPSPPPRGRPVDWDARDNDWGVYSAQFLDRIEPLEPEETKVMKTLLDDSIARGSGYPPVGRAGWPPTGGGFSAPTAPSILRRFGTFRFLITELVPLQLIGRHARPGFLARRRRAIDEGARVDRHQSRGLREQALGPILRAWERERCRADRHRA